MDAFASPLPNLDPTHGAAMACVNALAALARSAGDYAEDDKLSEFVQHRVGKVRKHLEVYPLTMNDVRAARDAVINCKELLEEVRDLCHKKFSKLKSGEATNEDRLACTYGSSACALYNSSIEAINACGLQLGHERLKSDGDGEVAYTPEEGHDDCPSCGQEGHDHEREGKKPRLGFVDADTGKVMGPGDVPKEVLEALLNALQEGVKKRKKKPSEGAPEE